jgi:hypothetical protein
MDEALKGLAIPEVFVQRGKQVALADRSGWFGLRSATMMVESRAWIYRFHVPQPFEAVVMRRVTETADLHLPGRGSI